MGRSRRCRGEGRHRRERHTDRDDGGERAAAPDGAFDAALPVRAESFGPGQVFADLVYDPAETRLLALARDRGALVVGGLGMLVHQAALQVERWAGRAAPLDAMRAAVEPGAGRV